MICVAPTECPLAPIGYDNLGACHHNAKYQSFHFSLCFYFSLVLIDHATLSLTQTPSLLDVVVALFVSLPLASYVRTGSETKLHVDID